MLIVDDDEDFGFAISEVLRNAGYDATVELDTQSALESMEKRKPDLVILDVMFPEDSSGGFELARTMRHYKESFRDIPVLMLSAVNAEFPLGFSTRDIDDQWMPVSDFLEKPVDFDILLEKVSKLLGEN